MQQPIESFTRTTPSLLDKTRTSLDRRHKTRQVIHSVPLDELGRARRTRFATFSQFY